MADVFVALPVGDDEVFAEGSAKGGGAGPAIKFTASKTGRGKNVGFRGASKLTANRKSIKKKKAIVKKVARAVPAKKKRVAVKKKRR